MPNPRFFGSVEEVFYPVSLVVVLRNRQGTTRVLESSDVQQFEMRPKEQDGFSSTMRDWPIIQYQPGHTTFEVNVSLRRYTLTETAVQETVWVKDGPTGIYLPHTAFDMDAAGAGWIEID